MHETIWQFYSNSCFHTVLYDFEYIKLTYRPGKKLKFMKSCTNALIT